MTTNSSSLSRRSLISRVALTARLPKGMRLLRQRFTSAILFLTNFVLLSMFGGCEDPPPPPACGAFLLGIRTTLPNEANPALSGGMGETLDGLSALRVTVARIDAVHRTDKNNPATEQVITVDSAEHTVELQGNLEDQASRQIAFLNVPMGFVHQLRLIVTAATISLRGDEYTVKVPSGEATGLKVVPIDGEPFEIKENERTAARIVFAPYMQLIRNNGQGFMMKPMLEAEHVGIPDISPILLDRIVVRFHDGIGRHTIDRINAEIGSTVMDQDGLTNYYILGLPVSITLADAWQFYRDRAEVRYALPDFVVHYRLSPCDAKYDPDTFNDIAAPLAWNKTTGDRKAIMAIVDFGLDLKSRDMLPNWFINQDEITGAQANLAHKIADVDGDGFITFIDLNDHILGPNPMNPQNSDLCPSGSPPITCDRDGDGLVTPVDIADGDPATFTDFENGIDDDPFTQNGKIDDLVGWDFAGSGDNSPHGPGAVGSGCLPNHGTGVASLMAAEGTDSSCPGLGIAGLNWSAQLIPIQGNLLQEDFQDVSTRSTAYMSFQYASRLSADVVNASFGSTIATVGTCADIKMEQDKFGILIGEIQKEADDVTFAQTIIVGAGANCSQNDDNPDIFDWPVELAAPNIIAVTAKSRTEDDLPGFAAAVGKATFDIAAPSPSIVLVASDLAASCGGNSMSAPLVSGTIGLMVASPNVPSCVKGNAVAMKNCLLTNSPSASKLMDWVANGRMLNTYFAVAPLDPVEVTCPCP